MSADVKLTKTMTLNLSAREMEVVEQLAADNEMSKTAVIRSAIRLYQMLQLRIRAGETMTLSGDQERVALFVGPGWDPETRTYDPEVQYAALRAATASPYSKGFGSSPDKLPADLRSTEGPNSAGKGR